MTARRGTSALGCLFTLVLVGAVVYFGAHLGRVYWRFYEFQDDMRQEVRFARVNSNDRILVRLRARADSLNLPEEAKGIAIRRGSNRIAIESEYYETLMLPMYRKDVLFHPHAEGEF